MNYRVRELVDAINNGMTVICIYTEVQLDQCDNMWTKEVWSKDMELSKGKQVTVSCKYSNPDEFSTSVDMDEFIEIFQDVVKNRGVEINIENNNITSNATVTAVL